MKSSQNGGLYHGQPHSPDRPERANKNFNSIHFFKNNFFTTINGIQFSYLNKKK